jgi:dUTP pyrophosphatase
VPRSGPAACDGIALVNVPMLIDAGYGSELRVLLLNADRTAASMLEPGIPIAQLVIASVAASGVVEVAKLAASGRRRRPRLKRPWTRRLRSAPSWGRLSR